MTKCACGNYKPYSEVMKSSGLVACAPMMPLDDCVNCHDDKWTQETEQRFKSAMVEINGLLKR